MDKPASTPSHYNDFLFATIDEERNGTPLTVLSALARLDIDPWREAARLAQLSKEQAIHDIGSELRALPGRRWSVSKSDEIAARVVGLLPKTNTPSLTAPQSGRQVFFPLVLLWVIFAAVWMAAIVEYNRPASNPTHTDKQVTHALPPKPLPSLPAERVSH